jgi:hypothetical protein
MAATCKSGIHVIPTRYLLALSYEIAEGISPLLLDRSSIMAISNSTISPLRQRFIDDMALR